MRSKGFTLVELLAVIVILAVILAIAIPGISNVIKNSTKGALESDAKLLLAAIDYKILEDETFDPSTVNETNVKSLLNIDDSNYQTLTVKKVNGKMYVTIVGKNKWDSLTVSGTKSNTQTGDTVTTLSNGANKPVLATNMVPIKWVPGAMVDEVWVPGTWVDTTATDPAWYNYDTTDKQWANARTEDGSMWVWIPRYIYRISTGWHSENEGTIDIQFSKGIDDNWNKAIIGNIDLGDTAASSDNKWTNHPGFTFGDTELTGIWVAKFEASGTTDAMNFVPNVVAIRGVKIGDLFTAARNMETNNKYGWGNSGIGIDTHMMKNSEWGVVAYLSKSVYGKDTQEIWINPATDHTTGCAGDSATSSATVGCLRTYETENGMQASTTGTIYGIYDISGGVWEYTAAYVDNGHSNLTTNGSSIINADAKYKDVYALGVGDSIIQNYNANMKKGDAVYEVSSAGDNNQSWFNDRTEMPYDIYPWFFRGDCYAHGISVGAFYFVGFTGEVQGDVGFRPVVLIGMGL